MKVRQQTERHTDIGALCMWQSLLEWFTEKLQISMVSWWKSLNLLHSSTRLCCPYVRSPRWFRTTNINATTDPGQSAESDLNERVSWKDGLRAPLTALTDSGTNRISPYGTSCPFFRDVFEIFSPHHRFLHQVSLQLCCLWWCLRVYSTLKRQILLTCSVWIRARKRWWASHRPPISPLSEI